MGAGNRHYQPPPDCPNCGVKNGATMGSTEWGHDIMCCGDWCGFEIKKKDRGEHLNQKVQKSNRATL